MSRNGHEKFNSSALTTLTNPKRKRATSGKRGRDKERGRAGEKGLSSNGTQSQQLLELLLLQLESHPSRTTKHVIFGQTMHDTESHTHTHTHTSIQRVLLMHMYCLALST